VVVLEHAPSTTGSGGATVAAKRIIVEDQVADAFYRAAARARIPAADRRSNRGGVPVGPLARRDLRDALAHQVRESVEHGARVLTGGRAPDRPGFYYEPSGLDHVSSTMPVLTEEVFGPAVPIVRAADVQDAIRLANDTSFRLGSDVWTSDLARGEEIAVQLDAGHTAVNGMTASDPRLPFGGVKDSGYGRELSSHGIHEFVNVHTVVVDAPTGPSANRQTTIE
jgi:succinate-semialdehyde dehydrogenase/glutarate-semialdehyde dehydrogenase